MRSIRGGNRGLALLASVAVAVGALAAGCGSEEGDDLEREVVDAAAQRPLDAEARAAVDRYREYVVKNAEQLVAKTDLFMEAVAAGDIDEAKEIYPVARRHFERIEPVAGAFGDLDPALDAREGDVPRDTWGGWHYFEKALWVKESTAGLAPYIEETLADTEDLRAGAKTIELTPAEIASGAVDLLGEVSASKITGEEERYSHTDLWDFEANVEGARAAFESVRPLVGDERLAKEIEARFADVKAGLDPYRRGEGFLLYTELAKADTRELSRQIDALAEPLSRLAEQVQG